MRLIFTLVLAFCAASVQASVITFETTPVGGTPVDDSDLTAPYSFAGGTVRFFFDVNGNNKYDAGIDAFPAFEQTGREAVNGFVSTFTGTPDTARPGFQSQLGTFFLRTPSGNTGAVTAPFIAAYDTTAPIRALSGEIWDIDGQGATASEQWRVDVLNGSGSVLATQLSPLGLTETAESLDSLPWTFQFDGLPDGVDSVRLTFVGTRPSVGVAFNNFSPDVAVPEPATGLLLFLVPALLCRRRRD